MSFHRQGQYGSEARDRGRSLRAELTEAEQRMWYYLRNRYVIGAKFRRQHPFGPYFLDFYCHERKLVIEIDGSQHSDSTQAAYYDRRTRYLEKAGLSVLRFNNVEVLTQTEGVLAVIYETLAKPSPNPLPKGEG